MGLQCKVHPSRIGAKAAARLGVGKIRYICPMWGRFESLIILYCHLGNLLEKFPPLNSSSLKARINLCLRAKTTPGTMADDPGEGEGEDERELELSTVAAIYPELTRNLDLGPFSASIDIPVDPVRGLLIRFPVADGAPLNNLRGPVSTDADFVIQASGIGGRSATVDSSPQDAHRLSHLPPLNLRLLLPDGYPAEQPPVFYLNSQYSWVPEKKLQHLRSAGNILWKDMGGDQVVFAYIDYLREEADKGFDLGLAEEEVVDISADLKVALLDFDLRAKRINFERATFECGICLGKPQWG